jgi:hypothetical protein
VLHQDSTTGDIAHAMCCMDCISTSINREVDMASLAE